MDELKGAAIGMAGGAVIGRAIGIGGIGTLVGALAGALVGAWMMTALESAPSWAETESWPLE